MASAPKGVIPANAGIQYASVEMNDLGSLPRRLLDHPLSRMKTGGEVFANLLAFAKRSRMPFVRVGQFKAKDGSVDELCRTYVAEAIPAIRAAKENVGAFLLRPHQPENDFFATNTDKYGVTRSGVREIRNLGPRATVDNPPPNCSFNLQVRDRRPGRSPCPSGIFIRSPTIRATVSTGEPAGKGLTTVIGRARCFAPARQTGGLAPAFNRWAPIKCGAESESPHTVSSCRQNAAR